MLKPLSATFVGNGSGDKERECDSNSDKLEVGRRHLSKMLQVKIKIRKLKMERRKKNGNEEWGHA